MKNPKLESAQVARWLQNLSDHEFITFFDEHLGERHIYRDERRHQDAHLVLANAKRDREDDGTTGPWKLELLCPTPGQNWASDAPVCQFGHHCGYATASVARQSKCPMCEEEVTGT